jgi:hypothetical protein
MTDSFARAVTWLLVQAAKAYAVLVRDRHHQPRVIRKKPKVVVAVARRHDRRLADVLDYGDAMVRINDLIPDLET